MRKFRLSIKKYKNYHKFQFGFIELFCKLHGRK